MRYKLMGKSDCKSCHQVETKSIGPSYKDISLKYKSDAQAIEKLAKKEGRGRNSLSLPKSWAAFGSHRDNLNLGVGFNPR